MNIASFNIKSNGSNNFYNLLDEVENIKSYIDCFEILVKEEYNKELNKEYKLTEKVNKLINKNKKIKQTIDQLEKNLERQKLQKQLLNELEKLITNVPYLSTKHKEQINYILEKLNKSNIKELNQQLNKIKSINESIT